MALVRRRTRVAAPNGMRRDLTGLHRCFWAGASSAERSVAQLHFVIRHLDNYWLVWTPRRTASRTGACGCAAASVEVFKSYCTPMADRPGARAPGRRSSTARGPARGARHRGWPVRTKMSLRRRPHLSRARASKRTFQNQRSGRTTGSGVEATPVFQLFVDRRGRLRRPRRLSCSTPSSRRQRRARRAHNECLGVVRAAVPRARSRPTRIPFLGEAENPL